MRTCDKTLSKKHPPSVPAPNDDDLDIGERLQQLETLGKTIAIDNGVGVMSYFGNTVNMINKADAQYAGNQLENALISYLKFIDLFRNKIIHHVDYGRVPLSAKSANQYYQRHARKRAQDLRLKLLERHRNHLYMYRKEVEKEEAAKKPQQQMARQSSSDMSVLRSGMMPLTVPTSSFDLEACRSLRTVVVPKQLPTIFQIVTQKIPNINFAVCGTMAGHRQEREYLVTHLIIPQRKNSDSQHFKVDSCDHYVVENGLQVLGWIHTHRFSSCYMSHGDLHVQCEMQKRLPEAVAIVCAPRYTHVEYYTLLGRGMEQIEECFDKDLHSHLSGRRLYGTARHVSLVHDRELEVVDLQEESSGEAC